MSEAKEFFIFGLENYLRGDYELAKNLFEKSLELSPDRLSTLTNYSATLIKLGQLEKALTVCEHILFLDNLNVDGMLNKSNVFKLQKKYNDSISLLNKVIEIDENNKEAYNNLGIIYHELKRYDLAINNYEKALSISNEFNEPRINMASSFLQIDRISEAINHLEVIIERDNQSYEAYCNLGIAYTKLNKISISLDYFDKALKLNPKYHKAIWNKSIALLLNFDYINGFKLYESRFFIDEFTKSELLMDKLGINLLENKLQIISKKIYVVYEQGYGDTIQFCRYIYQMVDLGGSITFKVQNPLLRLLKNSIKVATVVGDDFVPIGFDYYCNLLSLPYIFETSINTIVNKDKYLFNYACIENDKFLKLKLDSNKKIGIVWRGNKNHNNDRNRSISLRILTQHLNKAYNYISLQVDNNKEEIDFLNKNNIKYFSNIEDFNDTAYLCEHLDGVISVDTSVAHLSCALGIKTIILLPYSPDWRWGLGVRQTAWYNSAILLRQSKPNNWESALNNLSKIIEEII